MQLIDDTMFFRVRTAMLRMLAIMPHMQTAVARYPWYCLYQLLNRSRCAAPEYRNLVFLSNDNRLLNFILCYSVMFPPRSVEYTWQFPQTRIKAGRQSCYPTLIQSNSPRTISKSIYSMFGKVPSCPKSELHVQ